MSKKAIQECAPSELKAVGFWFENSDEGDATFGRAQMKSVKEIEEITKFTFFPDVDESVKASYNPAEWGF